jgi:NitT/TauT family transport system substrate-binding protein
MKRRIFLQQSSALGLASLLGLSSKVSAEPPPETTTLRIALGPWICYAPQTLAVEG